MRALLVLYSNLTDEFFSIFRRSSKINRCIEHRACSSDTIRKGQMWSLVQTTFCLRPWTLKNHNIQTIFFFFLIHVRSTKSENWSILQKMQTQKTHWNFTQETSCWADQMAVRTTLGVCSPNQSLQNHGWPPVTLKKNKNSNQAAYITSALLLSSLQQRFKISKYWGE